MTDTSNLRVDGPRLWASLMDMAQIGATPAGGCNRQALTEEDRSARALFQVWAEDAGCSVHVDAIGNLFARREGREPEAPGILIGSHLDTQPTGGKFDGVYGVLAGLEVIRSLNDLAIQTRSPLIVASWTNEEGSRFAPAMMGSGVWAGVFELESTCETRDKSGISVREALESIETLGDAPVAPFPLKAAFELHIEQGPILEDAEKTIGIVTGVQGIRWYDLIINGTACHAGPTPMESRRDPVQYLARLLPDVYRLAFDNAPWGRVTVGDLVAEPASRNTVPALVRAALDIRHPDAEVLNAMHQQLLAIVAGFSAEGISIQLDEVWHSPATRFDDHCIAAVRDAVSALGSPAMEMVSGAGHDSVYVSRVAPTAMIFIPCRDGLSHNEAEYAKPEDITAGCEVLLQAVLLLDEREFSYPD